MLDISAIAGLRDIAELLVDVGEDVDAKGQDGATPLRCAVQVDINYF